MSPPSLEPRRRSLRGKLSEGLLLLLLLLAPPSLAPSGANFVPQQQPSQEAAGKTGSVSASGRRGAPRGTWTGRAALQPRLPRGRQAQAVPSNMRPGGGPKGGQAGGRAAGEESDLPSCWAWASASKGLRTGGRADTLDDGFGLGPGTGGRLQPHAVWWPKPSLPHSLRPRAAGTDDHLSVPSISGPRASSGRGCERPSPEIHPSEKMAGRRRRGRVLYSSLFQSSTCVWRVSQASSALQHRGVWVEGD